MVDVHNPSSVFAGVIVAARRAQGDSVMRMQRGGGRHRSGRPWFSPTLDLRYEENP